MRPQEVRRCPLCGCAMRPVEGSQRTGRDRVFFMLRCPRCLHEEQDWYERRLAR